MPSSNRTPQYFTTSDLISRGWTPSEIRKRLTPFDARGRRQLFERNKLAYFPAAEVEAAAARRAEEDAGISAESTYSREEIRKAAHAARYAATKQARFAAYRDALGTHRLRHPEVLDRAAQQLLAGWAPPETRNPTNLGHRVLDGALSPGSPHRTNARLNSQLSPVPRELIQVLAENGAMTLGFLRAEVTRRLGLPFWLSKANIRGAIAGLHGIVIAEQSSLGAPWRIRLVDDDAAHGGASRRSV
jgi:hypothetical protein